LAAAAKYGDACNFFGDPEVVRHKLEVLGEHCERIGRDLSQISTTSALFSPESEQELVDQVGQRLAAGVDGVVLFGGTCPSPEALPHGAPRYTRRSTDRSWRISLHAVAARTLWAASRARLFDPKVVAIKKDDVREAHVVASRKSSPLDGRRPSLRPEKYRSATAAPETWASVGEAGLTRHLQHLFGSVEAEEGSSGLASALFARP